MVEIIKFGIKTTRKVWAEFSSVWKMLTGNQHNVQNFTIFADGMALLI